MKILRLSTCWKIVSVLFLLGAVTACDDNKAPVNIVCDGPNCADAGDSFSDTTDGDDPSDSTDGTEEPGDMTDGDTNLGGDSCSNEHDPSGTYLVSILSDLQSENDSPPIYLGGDVTLSGSSELDLSLQPLRTDSDPNSGDPRENPRTPVGDPIEVEGIAFNADGTFEISLSDVTVPGEANPISGTEIVADITLFGQSCNANEFCGTMNLDLKQPFEFSAGGNFGANKLESIDGAPDVSEPAVKCVRSDDPCEGLPDGSSCNGDILSYCDGESVVEFNCSEDGGSCSEGKCVDLAEGSDCEDGLLECAGELVCDGATESDFGTCSVETSCDDGIMNGDEEGVDCGGSCEQACPTCDDEIQNGDEEGVDCGGSCDPCGDCNDGVQNGDETGVDCGGSCASCSSCIDGEQNGTETGVDCGGPCGDCLEPGACNDPDSQECQDCQSANNSCRLACLGCTLNPSCQVQPCQADCDETLAECEGERPSCDDGIRSGDEEGIDCGGSCEEACPTEPTCSDGVQNGDENGIDCGGSCEDECSTGPTCNDGTQNGDEEGVDCGGSCPDACDGGDDFPPALEDLYDPEGPSCVLPNCDESGEPGFDTSGTYTRVLENTRSNCSSSVVSQNEIAGEGNTQTDEVTLDGIQGTCEYDHEGDSSIQTATIRDATMAACDFNERSLGVVSYETSIIEFDADGGEGMTRVYVTNVPASLGGDCDFDLDVTYTKQ